MNIKLKKQFSFIAPDLEGLGELRCVSSWEGFHKLQCAAGFMIVMDGRGDVTKVFEDAFGDGEAEYSVISASPDIAHELKLATANAQ